MNRALLVAGRELRAYTRSPLGYIVIAAALLIDGLYFFAYGLGGEGKAKLSADVLFAFFYGATGTTMIASIVLSMRLLAGERETGTLVMLSTAPIRDRDIVLGKYLAAFGLLSLLTLLSAYMPMLIFVNGRVSVGHIAVGYLGLLLLGSASLAVGLFASALARSQVLAAILGAALLGTLLLLWLVAQVTEPPLSEFLAAVAIHHERQRPFMTGVLRLENVVYYAGVTYLFLFGATKILEARRWR